MRTVLSVKIPVERIDVFAEMAWLEPRPELGLLCRAAMEQGDRVSIATVQSALPGLSDAGAKNVISWCQMLGLCDKDGGLAELGKRAAKSNEVPVPEQGTYGFWMAQHPLLGRRILMVERHPSNCDHRPDDIKPLDVEPDRNIVFSSVIKPDERFMLRDLPTNHGLRGDTKATCRLRWTLDFDAGRNWWQLDGEVEVPQRGMMPLKHQPEVDDIDLRGLADTWGSSALADFGKWSVDERRLAVQFKELTDDEQDNFRKTFEINHVNIPDKGVYDNVTLEDVPIGPRNEDEAQHWTMSRLTRSLTKTPEYRSRSQIRDLFAKLTEDTPLERFGPRLPAHGTLIARYAKQPDVFWGLAAPVDLALEPVPALDLDELTIGTTASEVTGAR